MIRADQSGMIYDFFMYSGKHSAGAKKYGTEVFEAVRRLVEQLPNIRNYQVFLDN